ncbi:MAG: S8 family serine peptidase [Bacteroidota bacterium]|nr:S8 family serine peptidase [Bacteroidota bacterium]MDP3145584.1 S8 family serine peptidase [Bacteroidota bacterium]
MRKTLAIYAAILIQLNFIAQKNNSYNLLLSSGTVELQSNFEQVKDIQPLVNEIFSGNYYRYIQFLDIPSTAQKKQLSEKGIDLLLYLPTNTYMASIKRNTNIAELANFGIRGVYSIKPEYKLLNELSIALNEKNFPGYAVKGNNIGISFTSYSNISFDFMKGYLQANGYKISYEDKSMHWFVVWINKNEILDFVNLPFVCSAELVDDTPKLDNNVGRTDHRSNAIATDYSGGRKFNGAGSVVMLQDDGIIGPHIDYTGRLPMQFMTNNIGDHGDHCAGTIFGGGNLNPLTRGMAWGAELYAYNASPNYQGFDSITSHYGSLGIRIISTSYSDGCNAGYTTRAQKLDIQNLAMPELIHVFSAGNNGTSNCNYGAGAGWGNVTGGHKHSKNSIAVANLDYLDVRNNSSSRGPAHDGRLKPEVSAVGTSVYSTSNPNTYVNKTGTSMSCPAIAGVFAQLYEAYRSLNSNNNPKSGLMKAIVMNTADDLGNAGPDFGYGYGRVNALKAVQAIEAANYLSGIISNAGVNTHSIIVPAGVRKMKVMTYWHDYQAAVSASVALVNNLNTTVTNPSSIVFNPLILDFTPNATNLNSLAVPGIDVRNNHEQVTINNPTAGNYVVTVNGASVPMGPQEYFVTWIFEMDGYTITYPIGGEGFVPTQIETIRWDALETVGTQTLQYTINNGTSWTNISTAIAGTQRYFNWTVPSALSGQCKVRINRGVYSAESDTSFSIIPLPTSISVAWACPDSVKLTWNAAAGATSYDVFKLGNVYMDSVGTSTTTSFVIPNTLSTQTHWFSVRARGPLSAVGRRANAIQKTPGVFACPIITDVSNNSFLSNSSFNVFPNPGYGVYSVSVSGLNSTELSYRLLILMEKKLKMKTSENKLVNLIQL